MNKFKTDEFLGKTVKNIKMFCSIGTEPIKDMFQLRFAAGGNKFSQLCGFLFDSANESTEYPRFAVAFVCKLRSKKYKRNGSNGQRSVFNTTDSQWFLFRRISNQRVDVLDKKAMLVNYGFDIDKFFDSDLFNAAIPRFQETLKKGVKDCIAFADKLKGVEKTEADKFIAAIQDSMQFIKNHDVNDKFYTLNDLDAVDNEIAKIAKTPEQRQKELDAKTAAIHQDAIKRMAGAKKYSDKAAKKDYIYQKLHGEDEVNEDASMYECIVKKEKDHGEDVFVVYEKKENFWVATFHDEAAANAFAKEYPKMKEDYLKRAAEIESEKSNEKTESEEDKKTKELDDKIEEAMKEIYK